MQNGFLIIREEEVIPSPISIVHYEKYENESLLFEKLIPLKDQLQCIVSKTQLPPSLKNLQVGFGKTQEPALWDYADGVDTLDFLQKV